LLVTVIMGAGWRGWVRFWLRALVLTSGGLFITWVMMPTPVVSLAWQPPPPPPLEGPLFPNQVLLAAQFHAAPAGTGGPEHVWIDADGTLTTGLANGDVAQRRGSSWTTMVNTRGRPLGLARSRVREGRWYIADAVNGLLQYDEDSQTLTTLATHAEGETMYWVNAVAVAADDTVYFTSSSSVWSFPRYTEDILDQRPTGRLLRFDPRSGAVTVLARELLFANGVVLLPDEQSVVVAETGRYRLWRVVVGGSRTGEREVFMHNLPGFPDNLSLSPRGTLWVALAAPRKRLLDMVHPWPWMKDPMSALPERLRPKPARWGFVLEVDAQGTVLRSLQDASGAVAETTSAAEVDGQLWVGTLYGGLYRAAL
jgi:sugar lactone lactonase YvrE